MASAVWEQSHGLCGRQKGRCRVQSIDTRLVVDVLAMARTKQLFDDTDRISITRPSHNSIRHLSPVQSEQ
jgi:hypothetical protein